jgi:two-component system phosphate regulon response regulator PhoB
MERLLLIEDATEYQILIKGVLSQNFHVVAVDTLDAGRREIEKGHYDLIMLDIVLPDGDGFKFCGELSSLPKTANIPIIILTSRSALTDKILGFSLGADDYVVKPFEALELKARIEAKINRYRKIKKRAQVLTHENLRVELNSQRAFLLNHNGEVDLQLTPIEFKILHFLLENAYKAISRKDLTNHVWGDQIHVFDRAPDKHVSSLRFKLNEYSCLLETIPGLGYRFGSALPKIPI